jgi:hypothetical protein
MLTDRRDSMRLNVALRSTSSSWLRARFGAPGDTLSSVSCKALAQPVRIAATPY